MRVSHERALEEAARMRRQSRNLLVLGSVFGMAGGAVVLAVVGVHREFLVAAVVLGLPFLASSAVVLRLAYENRQASRRIRREADIDLF